MRQEYICGFLSVERYAYNYAVTQVAVISTVAIHARAQPDDWLVAKPRTALWARIDVSGGERVVGRALDAMFDPLASAILAG
jgi:hypothetical protein